MDDFLFVFEELLTDDEEDVIDIVEAPRIPRVFQTRPNHFDIWNDREFVTRFRISKLSVEMLLNQIGHLLQRPTNQNYSLSPMTQLLLTLRFYASGSYVIVASDFGGIHMSTASQVIKKVSESIASLANIYIKMPQSADEILQAKNNFYQIARFPNAIGAIDCTHIKIQSPGGDDAEQFRNRKGWMSLNVQTVSSADLKITNIVVRWPGAASDKTIFANSRLKAQLEEGRFGESFLLGDSGYAINRYLMIPLANPVTRAEELYNESHIRTRNVVERQYGIWKRRFPVLRLEIRLKLQTTQNVVIATAVLHNIAIGNNDIMPLDIAEEDPNPNEYHNIGVDNPDGANQIRENLINTHFALLAAQELKNA